MNDLERDAMVSEVTASALQAIRAAAWFPVKTGRLRDRATYQATMPSLSGVSASAIVFDASVAPYVGFLERGTGPHDIPGAFGYPPPFGIGGRFAGRFHPGSIKHMGFISFRAYNLAGEVVASKMRRLGRVFVSGAFGETRL